jgi:hypothetical protein
MSLDRSKVFALACLVALCAASTASAQSYKVGDLQLFRPWDPTTYGDPQPNTGFWLEWDYLNYSITKPRNSLIGAPGSRNAFVLVIPTSAIDPPTGGGFSTLSTSLNSGQFDDAFHQGQRVNFGYLDDSGCGWGVSSFLLHNTPQYIYATGPTVLFDDPQDLLEGYIDVNGPDGLPDGFDDDINGNGIYGRFGRDTDDPPDGIPDGPPPVDPGDQVDLPMTFASVIIKQTSKSWGTDAMRTWRTKGGQFGGWIDWGFGLRYLAFYDTFHFQGFGDVLDDTNIRQWADNNMIGPQFSIRWFNTWCRWTYVADLRVAPTVNFQSVRQRSAIGSNLTPGPGNSPLNLGPSGSNDSFHAEEFSPVVELRLGAAFKLTERVALRAGVNGIYTDSIARSVNMIEYAIPYTSIIRDNNTQDVFLWGANFGIEINR